MAALKLNGFWNWDHTTNWSADSNQVETGCFNKYTKAPESFIADMRLCMERMNRLGLNCLVLYGLFRDTHLGEKGAREVLRIARENRVKVLAGCGINCYGGFYWEGNHPFNLKTWLDKHPELAAPASSRAVDAVTNRIGIEIACPSKEENIRWHEEGIKWLLDNFDVAGVNLETGDYGVCGCDECKRRSAERSSRISDDDMGDVLPAVINAAYKTRRDTIVTYATYGSFTKAMAKTPPVYVKTIPKKAIAQWTITWMTDRIQGNWKGEYKPPTPNSIAFSHWGSQWMYPNTRHSLMLNHIREICRSTSKAGMQGLLITGELDPDYYFNANLNYEALSYFTKHPQDSFSAFAKARLAERFGSPGLAAKAVRYLTGIVEPKELNARIRDTAAIMEQHTKGEPLYTAWSNVAYDLFARTL